MEHTRNGRTLTESTNPDIAGFSRTFKMPLMLSAGVIVVGIVVICCVGGDNAARTGAAVNWVYTVVTALLVFVVYAQIRAAQAAATTNLEEDAKQRRKWATLQACDRYDQDAQIRSAIEHLRQYHPFKDKWRLRPPTRRTSSVSDAPHVPHKPGAEAPSLTEDQRYTMSAGLLLNYFDSIAIGIDQGFYDEEICRVHIGPIVKRWVTDFSETDPLQFDEVMKADYSHLLQRLRCWSVFP